MTARQPFMPTYGSNQILTAGAASLTAAIPPGNKQVRIVNTGANKAYFRTFNSLDGAQSATSADCPIAAGMATTVTKPDGGRDAHNAFAYISATGTTLEMMTGEGW